jgi:hypothetical protein
MRKKKTKRRPTGRPPHNGNKPEQEENMSPKLDKQLEKLDRSHQGRQNAKTAPVKLRNKPIKPPR